MQLPNFFIVGAAKAGTTSLWRYLLQHPEVFMPADIMYKEPAFFSDIKGDNNLDQYMSLFSGVRNEKMIGEASTAYLTSPESPARIVAMIPYAKIIIMLRNPIDRAFSLYNWMACNGYEPIESFEEALKIEQSDRYCNDYFCKFNPEYYYNYLYFNSGLYSQQIKRYLDVFNKKQIHYIIFENFKSDINNEVRKVYKFLGVNETFLAEFQVHNKGSSPYSTKLQFFIRQELNKYLRPPYSHPHPLKNKVIDKLMNLNTRPENRLVMKEQTRELLSQGYYQDVLLTGEMIDIDLTKWWCDFKPNTQRNLLSQKISKKDLMVKPDVCIGDSSEKAPIDALEELNPIFFSESKKKNNLNKDPKEIIFVEQESTKRFSIKFRTELSKIDRQRDQSLYYSKNRSGNHRIWMVADHQKTGGAAIACHRLFTGLNKRKIDLKFLTFNTPSDSELNCYSWTSYFHKIGGFDLNIESDINIPSNQYWSSEFIEVINKTRPEVINIHNIHEAIHYHGLPFDVLDLISKGARLVFTLHDMWWLTGRCAYTGNCQRFIDHSCNETCPTPMVYPQARPNDISALLRVKIDFFNRNPDAVIVAPSQWLKKQVQKSYLKDHRVEVIPYGIDTTVFRPDHDREGLRRSIGVPRNACVLMISAANLSDPRKGARLFLKALSKIKDDLIVLTVGKTNIQPELPKNIKFYNYGFVTSSEEMAFAYSVADLFICPSLEDNLPCVLIESISCGTPCIGFNVGGVQEVIRPGKTGWLATEMKSESLSGLIAELIKSPEKLSALRTSCRVVAKKEYALNVQAERYLKLYHELVGQAEDMFKHANDQKKNRENNLESEYEVIQKYIGNGEINAAKVRLETLVDTHPRFAIGHNDLGVLAYKEGLKEEALKHYEAAVKLQPENIVFLKNLADYYYVELGQIEDAMKFYVKVLQIEPKDIETLMVVGHLCIAIEKYSEAKNFYEKIIEIDSDNEEARDFIEKLDSKCSEIERKQNHVEKPIIDDLIGLNEIDTNKYLVSAIVSTYNANKFIRGCLDDLEKQTIADRLEIIVVNSGSTESEEAIVREFQTKYENIKYIRSDKRETVYAAWNRGIKAASGKYITNANTDDRHRTDAFEIMVKALEFESNIGAVYADCLITENENETFNNHSAQKYFRRPNYNLRQMLIFSFFGPQPMWRHSVHRKIGYFDETLSVAADYDFFIRLSLKFGALHINEILGLYTQRKNSIENNNREKCVSESFQILRKYRKLISIEKIYPNLEKAINCKGALSACMVDQGNCCLLGDLPDFESAMYYYTKALKDRINLPEVNNNIAIALCMTGQFDQGMKVLSQQAKSFPKSSENLKIFENYVSIGEAPSYRRFQIAEIYHPVVIAAKQGKGLKFIDSQVAPVETIEHFWSGSEMVRPLSFRRRQLNEVDNHSARVSVIVRTKDRPKFLRECLDSIAAQTYRDIEVILVNDGGMDVGTVVKEFSQQTNIKYKCHHFNRGKTASLNTGLKSASGQYITYLDDDDLIYPEHIKTLVQELKKGDYKVAYSDSLEAKQQVSNGSFDTVERRLVYSKDFDRELLKRTNYIPILNLMHHRECVEKIGLFDDKLQVLEDWDYWIRLSKFYDFIHIPKITSEYRVRDDRSNATAIDGHLFPSCRELIWSKNGIYPCHQRFKNKKLLVSMVVLTCNQLEYTRKCIDSVVRYTDLPFELVVIDNGSKDGTVNYLEKLAASSLNDCEIKIIKNKTNLGFAAGINQGLAVSRGNYILLMNNDIIVTPGWLNKLVQAIERKPEIGIVGPKSNNVSGPQEIKNVGYNVETLEGLEIYSKKLAEEKDAESQQLLRVVGFCMLIKREVTKNIGGMDYRFGLGNFEDDDFSLRAALAGFESWMVEDCFVHHFGSRTFIGEKIDYRESLHKNWEIFKRKWGLPSDLPYGSLYSLSQMKISRFDPKIHYIPLSLNYNNTLQNCRENLATIDKEYSVVCSNIEKEDLKVAIEKLKGFAKRYVDYALVYNDMGVLFFQKGDNESALKNYQKAVKLNPQNINFKKNLADLLSVTFGELEEALQHYVAVLASDPKDVEALSATGHICARLERYDDATEFYERVLEIEPNNSDAANWRAKMLERKYGNSLEGNLNDRYLALLSEIDHEDLAGAIQIIENFIEMYPKLGQAHNDLGVLYYKDESKTKVFARYLKAVQLEPENVTFRKNLADFLYVEEGRVEEALENYVEVLRIKPDDVETLLITGHICTAIERFEDAMSFYHKVLNLEPKNLDARQNMEALIKRQILMLNQEARDEEKPDDDTEINHFERRASVDKMPIVHAEVVEDLINNAELLFQQERIDQAVDTLLKAIAVNPSDGRAYVELAEQLVNHGRHENALEVLAEMPTSQPVAVAMQKLLVEGYAEEGMGNYEEAKKCSDSVLDREHENAKALNLNGILAYRNGDKATAEQHFKRAIELDSEYGEPHTNIGALVWETSEPKIALEHYERGFSISPTAIDVANAYHEAVSATGEYIRAEKVARSALKKYPQCRKIFYLLVDTLIRQEKNEEALKELETALSTFGIDEGLLDTALAFRERVGKIKKTGSAKKPGVSLCMIVKNEEANLPRCLASVKPIVDEMVVVDTGSTDRTRDIAEFIGAKVFNFEWTVDFAAARNFSISKAKGDWLLIMDADEVISPQDYARFRELTANKPDRLKAYSFVTRNYCHEANTIGWHPNDGHYVQEEAGFGWLLSEKVRLFRNRNEIKFEGAVHEMVDPVLKRIGIKIKKSVIPIHHYGRLNTDMMDQKRRIYYEIGLKKLAENGSSIGAVRELAIQATALEKNSEAIKLWQKFLSMKPGSRAVPEAYLNMGSTYLRMKDYEKALTSAQKAVAFRPEMKEAQYNLGMAELYNGNAAAAVRTLKRLIESHPYFPPAQFLLAASKCCKKDTTGWNGDMKKLKRSSFGPILIYSVAELAEGLMTANQHKLALKLLHSAIEEEIVSKDIMKLYSACVEKNKDSRNMGGKIPEEANALQESVAK